MVKVIITGVVISPPFLLAYSPGEEANVTEETAKKLIAAGLAIPVSPTAETATKKVPVEKR